MSRHAILRDGGICGEEFFMRKYQKVQAVIMCAALAASSMSVWATEEASSEAQTEAATEAVSEASESEESGEVSYPLTVTGTDGTEITIESEPESIVSMGPNMTEILYAIGAGDKLVGRTDYCDYPAEVSEVESVGSISNADIEKILSLEPDLVLASTHFSDDAIQQLEDAGVPVLYLYDEGDMDGVYNMIDLVGEAVNCKEEAEKTVDEMKAKLDYVSERLATANENPTVYYVVGYGEYGDYTAGGDTFVNGILTAAGGDNIASDVEGWSYSTETLLEKNPEYIIMNEYNEEGFCTTAPYTELGAVQDGRILTIDTNMLDRQGPRNADAVVELAQTLHPECFPAETEYPVSVQSGETEYNIEACPESVYAASEEVFDLLKEIGVVDENAEYEEKSVEDVVSEAPAVVVADAEYSAEEKAQLDEANIPVIYVDAADNDSVTLLGQIFNCNAKADEVSFVKSALAE